MLDSCGLRRRQVTLHKSLEDHQDHLGLVILASCRTKSLPHYEAVRKCVLPCSPEEAAAVFATPQWVTRLSSCVTHEEVMDMFRMFHELCWSERSAQTKKN